MADLYRVIYESKRGQATKVVNVSATSLANALAAAITNDVDHKQSITATITQQNIVVGS